MNYQILDHLILTWTDNDFIIDNTIKNRQLTKTYLW